MPKTEVHTVHRQPRSFDAAEVFQAGFGELYGMYEWMSLGKQSNDYQHLKRLSSTE